MMIFKYEVAIEINAHNPKVDFNINNYLSSRIKLANFGRLEDDVVDVQVKELTSEGEETE